MRGRALDEETRVLVMGALMAGLGVSDVARKYKLPRSTVSRIRAGLGSKLEQVGTESRSSLDELLVEALGANLTAQKRIAEAIGNAEYITNQPAGAVAELYETLADKAIRLLEAASFTSEGSEPEA